MINNEKYEAIKNNINNHYNNQLNQLKVIKEQLVESQNNNDIKKIDFYTKRINTIMETLTRLKNVLKCMRLNNEKVLIDRQNIICEYANKVKESIPDNIPIVFHGNNNIETVKQIIESGGLFTPDDRGIDYKSFATQIDVTYKNDIQVSLDFADSGMNSFMPYGAIFAFYPKENEIEKVLNTGNSSEVEGGVASINFITEPERLFAIITTDESIDTLKKLCKEKGIDPLKVLKHEEFLELCKNRFNNLGNIENNILKGK